jgi:hypothetical protein
LLEETGVYPEKTRLVNQIINFLGETTPKGMHKIAKID